MILLPARLDAGVLHRWPECCTAGRSAAPLAGVLHRWLLFVFFAALSSMGLVCQVSCRGRLVQLYRGGGG